MKISFKKKDSKKEKEDAKSKIVTQKNLEESREQVLQRGKKFKYPFQYSKHKLVINTIIISVIAIVALMIFGWVELYKVQNTGSVAYRFTKVLNLSVAKIDNIKVRYSDYLMFYRSSVKSIEYQQGDLDDSDDSKMLRQHYKRQAMTSAEDASYALEKLNQAGIAVESSEVDELVNYHMQINGQTRSLEAFTGIVSDNFGLSMTEYRRLLTLSLAKKKYSEKFDDEANKLKNDIVKALEADGDMKAVSDKYANNVAVLYEKTDSFVSDTNLDGGRVTEAMKLKKVGDISEPFASKKGDCYYIVKLTEKKDDKVRYESIRISFSHLDSELKKLREEGKVKEYIKVTEGETVSVSDEKKD
jgi:hypothetical protein